MDAQERFALEQELAAELAAISAEELDVEFDDDICPNQCGDGYVRLDVNQLLSQQLESADSHGFTSAATEKSSSHSWDLFLKLMQEADQSYFNVIAKEIEEVHTTFLLPIVDVNASATTPHSAASTHIPVDPAHSSASSEIKGIQAKRDVTNATEVNANVVIEPTVDPVLVDFLNNPFRNNEALLLSVDQHPTSPAHEEPHVKDVIISLDRLEQAKCDAIDKTNSHVEDQQRTSVIPATETANVDTISSATPSSSATNDCNSTDQNLDAQIEHIKAQHLARESLRLRVQVQQQQEQQKIATMMEEMEQQWQRQEEQAKEQQQEQKERVRMAEEEILCRTYIIKKRQRRENQWMQHEEVLSRWVHDYFIAETRKQHQEVSLMRQEEQLMRQFVRFHQETQRKQRLIEEKCTLRRRFNDVMMQLVAGHELKQRLEAEIKKKQLRELSLMRGEELRQRRVLIQLRAIEEERIRVQNRVMMTYEDELAFAWRWQMAQDHRQMEEEDQQAQRRRLYEHDKRLEHLNILSMQKEEEWAIRRHDDIKKMEQTILHEKQVQRLLQCVHIQRKRQCLLALQRWQHWNEAINRAAKIIQRWYLSREACIRVEYQHKLDRDMEEKDSVTASTAAMMVQSAFRGFYIRRKFANALEMARVVCRDDQDGDYDEVNLDDLIQAPPELEDGWEDPSSFVNYQTTNHVFAPDSNGNQDDQAELENGPEEDNDDFEDEVVIPQLHQRLEVAAVNPSHHTEEILSPPKELNLAASLWNKMRKVKQKQQHALAERQKQQDPMYRVQKLLHKSKKSQSHVGANHNNQHYIHGNQEEKQCAAPTITWSTNSNSNATKKPKVKLPSLVERLRKKTAAER